MNFIFEQVRLEGSDRNFGYVVGDRAAKVCVLVDPAYTPNVLVDRAKTQGLTVTHIINTHGHQDHINGNAKAKALTGAKIAAHRLAANPPDVVLEDKSTLDVGSIKLSFLFTPGHIEDHLVVVVAPYVDQPLRLAITGDLLFTGKVGGTKTDADARVEWASLQRVLNELPDDTTTWGGHDYGCRPSSTIGLEKRTNPFLQCKTADEFIKFKSEWAMFKAEKGLK